VNETQYYVICILTVTYNLNFSIRNKTNKCIQKYVNLLQYKQLSPLHASATYCGHLQEGVFKEYITQNVKTIYKYKIPIKVFVLNCAFITACLDSNTWCNEQFYIFINILTTFPPHTHTYFSYFRTVSPYTQHMNMQFSTNFIYFSTLTQILKFLFKT